MTTDEAKKLVDPIFLSLRVAFPTRGSFVAEAGVAAAIGGDVDSSRLGVPVSHRMRLRLRGQPPLSRLLVEPDFLGRRPTATDAAWT